MTALPSSSPTHGASTQHDITREGTPKRHVTDLLYWIAGTFWDRDTNAGIEQRATVHAGLGTAWWDREGERLASDYSVSYIARRDEVDDPGRLYDFVGSRFSVSWLQGIGTHGSFSNDTVYTVSLQDAKDRNLDVRNARKSNLNDLLALRVGLELIHHNFPALGDVDLFDVVPRGRSG